MNTKKWLTLGLTVALAGCLGWAVAACAPTEPKEPDEGDNPSTPHTHTFTKWDYSDTEHWKVCPDDGELDVSSRAPHTVDKKTHTCECGYQEPHTHTYTKQAYDSTGHWMECSDDGAVDESTRADHSLNENGVCDCGYSVTKAYVAGHIESYPGSELPKIYERAGKDIGEEIAKNCPEMTLSEDGTTYTVEIYLTPADYFGIYYTTWQNGRAVSAGEPFNFTSAYGKGGSGVMTVEKAGSYIISWTGPGKAATLREHDHTYTGWAYDATQHWKVCPDDGAVDPDYPKTSHVYDQPDNKCVCGAVQTTSCDHSKGYAFQYEALPAVEASGGTLDKFCPDCQDKQTVTYQTGIQGDGSAVSVWGLITSKKALNHKQTGEGSVYVTNTSLYMQLAITKAGTYTVNIDAVHLPDESDMTDGIGRFVLGVFGLSATSIDKGTAPDADLIWFRGAFNTYNTNAQSAATGHSLKVNGKDLADYDLATDDVNTISFTVTAEDLASGTVYVTMGIGYGHLVSNSSGSSYYNTGKLGYLVTTKKTV